MLNLKIIVTSTRPGRKGIVLGNWLAEFSKALPEFNVELLDLAEINLPFMNEANHPAMRKYEHQHTRDWSAKIEEADAFIFVTPEYNYSLLPPSKTRSTTCTLNGNINLRAFSAMAVFLPAPAHNRRYDWCCLH
ncbi:NAD(P)H-dependent oxidoreductase [Chitinophaga sedimenti]|nr:NAD(P)H-dependent oxidoreductase [Chitinophaga sedimenti]MCK7559836.1 NAD(P)H-dependent oxidoreductase [Chitinophaga sedimenti]